MIIGVTFICTTLPATAENATRNANSSVMQPNVIQRPAPNRFTSGVRAAKPSSHLGPNFRTAKPSSHLGPNFRTTGHGADSRKR
ncbi:hypothetical protein GCM10007385_10770 [Tateyamaria omphalii]|nr:hypothetical protein GCM10007385_10770 [Tateyamaria omphalii]